MRNKVIPLIAMTLSVCVAGCAGLRPEPAGPARYLEGGPSVLEANRRLLPPQPELGIALSGGGLRSALYSAGVLRALYEKKVLQDVDVLSTVSGGGYTAYWLYTGQENASTASIKGAGFGAARLDDKVYGSSLCELIGNANFVPFKHMAASFSLGGRPRTVGMYTERLRQGFGDRDEREIRLSELGTLVRRGYPYLILGATVEDPEPTGWNDAVYEFTAAGTRWGPRGEKQWTAAPEAAPRPTPPADIAYIQAVAISGAAFGPALKQRIVEPTLSSNSITLYDVSRRISAHFL